MDGNNPAFTGFFSDGLKRIDIVLVIADGDGHLAEEMRINYLKNLIKFGLLLELDDGKMSEHRNLIFVKVHAPDSIIEEYGLYFNVRKFFKDNHVERIEPFLYPLRIKHERQYIKLVREQYPGPGNYSTLERSNIVYNIINRLPFGEHKKPIGINRLRKLNIIIDAFALHDGPYFLASAQKTCINARQTLFYNWVGIKNMWTSQPIHMIQEYLGERIAMYFAYYEFFNFMLLFPAILGFLIVKDWEQPESDTIFTYAVCHTYKYMEEYVCPQCRHFDLCPFRLMVSYCKELKFLEILDTFHLETFAIFVSIWGIVFAVLWNRKQYYLMWIWEVKEKCNYRLQKFHKSRLTGMRLDKFNCVTTFNWSFQIILCVALFGAWVFGMFILSTHIWYVKHWLDKIYNKDQSNIYLYTNRYSEYLFIGIQAGVYSILTTALKILAKMLSHKLTALEYNKTIRSYGCSLALKLYGFYFTGTFALLTFHTFVGNIFYTHLLDMSNWYSISGFKVMNNGLGTSLDDMCITLAVAVFMEQIIVKIPFYVQRKNTDYEVLNKNAPVWEREYKLDTLKDEYFHFAYNDIAIQFAMATLFSLTFPLAPLLILLINIWDIRHKARNLLLTYRRPLILNTSGPAIWHNMILFTSYLVPVFNVYIIALQSKNFTIRAFKAISFFHDKIFVETWKSTFDLFTGPGSPAEEYEKSSKVTPPYCVNAIYDHWFYKSENNNTFVQEYQSLHVYYYKNHYILIYSIIGVLVNLLIYFKFPPQSSDVEDAAKTELRIKQKYYIQKGFLPNEV